MTDGWSNAIVESHEQINPGLFILRVAPDGWELPAWEAGQFAVLGLPETAPRCDVCDEEDTPAETDKLIKRVYSIASSPVEKEFLEFYVALVPSGRLTPRLIGLNAGDRVWLGERIKGEFTLANVPAEKNIALVGTGTGLAPCMSMLRTHLICGGPRRFAVLHGARHSWDLGYRSELATLQRVCSNFAYLPAVSRTAEEHVPWTGAEGYVQDLWKSGRLAERWGIEPTPENTDVFLCGNPAMVEAMIETLAVDGFVENTHQQPGQVHAERYW